MNRPPTTAAVAATLLLAAAASTAQTAGRDTTRLPPAVRDLWLGTEGRFVKQWLLLGPVGDFADEVATPGRSADSVRPEPGGEHTLSGGHAPRWRAHTSWGDVADGFAEGMKAGDAGFAYATVEREQAGDAVLSLGGNVRGVWINGAWADGPWARGDDGPPSFVIDGTQARVPLAQGANRLLLKIVGTDRPAFFAMRVLEAGFVLDTSANVAPYIDDSEGNVLRVRPGARSEPDAADVLYEALGAGGRVRARHRLPRTADARLDTASWPDGAYEVRVTTRDSRGGAAVTHLPWYKGDAAAAARRLVSSAAAPGADGHVRMLAEMVRDRVGESLERLASESWPLLHSPLLELEELQLEAAGQTGGARASGFVRLAWVDDVDGSTQFCRAYLPSEYPGTLRWPTVVWLHGYHPENPPYVRWWSIGERHNGVAERHGLIVLEPFGRGNVDYRWIGERDVLRCLAEARRRFAVDDDRVYLGGESMGGNGTWLIASRHPQLFAAAAPVFGGWDYRVWPSDQFNNPRGTRPSELFAREAQSSFASAEGLLHVPLLVVHGDVDAAVPVEHSRHAVRMLQRWGYDLRYHEIPGRGHEDLGRRDAIAAWLLEHRRRPAPRDVRLRAIDLAGASAHWVEVTGWLDPLALVEVNASVVQPGLVRLQTRNVATVRLTPPRELLGPTSTVRVVWNGEERRVAWSAGGTLQLAAAGIEARAGDKGPAMEGRLSYFFGTPFAIVVGTSSSDPQVRRLCREKAETLSRLWQRWQHVRPRLLRDHEVTAEHERRYSLLLIGGASANRVAARLAARLPFTVEPDAVTVDGRRFAATDAVAQVLYPSPSQPDRYVLVVAATSAAGMHFWNPGGFWVQENGYPRLPWDWTIQDGRRVVIERGLGAERGFVAAGVFDRHWRRDDRWVLTGDEALRAKATLRRAPGPGFALSPARLDAYAGRYRFAGDRVVRIARDGSRLVATLPDGRTETLVPETSTDFSVESSAAPLSFELDATGRMVGFRINNDGQEASAARLD